MTWHVMKPNKRGSLGGYHMVKIRNDKGKLKSIGRYRLLVLAFLGVPKNIDIAVINHKNGKPWDDRIDNLEWTTRSGNNQHAYDTGLKSDARPILVKNMIDGTITRYNTLAMCARTLGYTSATFIQWRLRKGTELKRYSDELMFKYDDGTPWPEIDWFNTRIQRGGVCQDYFALNVFTKELITFHGLWEGQRLLGVDRGTICSHVNHGYMLPINGYIVRFRTSDVKWPKFNDRVLAICKDHPYKQPNGIIALDLETNEELFFTSSVKAAEHFNVKKETIWFYSRIKKPYRKRYLISVFRIHEVMRSLQSENSG